MSGGRYVSTMPEWMRDVQRRLRYLETSRSRFATGTPQASTTPPLSPDEPYRLRFPAGTTFEVHGPDITVIPPPGN